MSISALGETRTIDRGLRAGVALTYAFLYVPLLVIVVFSFNDGRFISIWNGFSTRWFGVAIHDGTLLSAVGTSLVIALLATAVSTVLGTMTAYQLERVRPRVRAATDAFTYMRIMLPELVGAMGLLVFVLFLQTNVIPWLKLGTLTVVIGHVTWNVAYVILIVRARLVGMDPALREAALDLGATPARAFRRVILPDLLPGIVAAALLAFTFSFDNFVTTFFLAGPGVNTLPLQLYSMIRFGLTPEVNAVSAMLLALTLLLVAAFLAVTQAGRRRR